MKKKVVILHNQIVNNTADEVDVLEQRDLVATSCKKLGFSVECLTVGDDLKSDIEKVKAAKPDIVFNIVESTWGKGELIYFAPAVLNSLKIPYTGIPLDALFISTNKVLAKNMMSLYDLPTADYFSIDEVDLLNPDKTYIVKPIWEEASVGIDADSVFCFSDKEKINKITQLPSSQYFIEEFISGFEFNVSVLAEELALENLNKDPEKSAYIFNIAEFEDRPVGFTCYGKIPGTADSYDLYWIAVHDSQRGKGLGKTLMVMAVDDIAHKSGKNIWIETSSRAIYEPTRQFYLKTGCEIIAELPDFYGAMDNKLIFHKKTSNQ